MFTHQELIKETSSLRKYALKLSRNSDDADDLVQLTLVKALDRRDTFEAGTSLLSWTATIMYNAFISGCRKNFRIARQDDIQIPPDEEYIDNHQESDADLEIVLLAMMSLSKDHREIIRLVCIDGLPYPDVALHLQIPVGTVRSRLSRARQNLQESLKFNRSTRFRQLAEAM